MTKKKLSRRCQKPWPCFGHVLVILPDFVVLFEYRHNCNIQNYKQLVKIRNGLSTSVPGTKEILQVVQDERNAKSFFFYISVLAMFWPCFRRHHLYFYFQKKQLSIFKSDGKEHPFLTIFVAVLGT